MAAGEIIYWTDDPSDHYWGNNMFWNPGDFCAMDKGTVSEGLVVTGMTLDGVPIYSVPVPYVGVDQLLKVNK